MHTATEKKHKGKCCKSIKIYVVPVIVTVTCIPLHILPCMSEADVKMKGKKSKTFPTLCDSFAVQLKIFGKMYLADNLLFFKQTVLKKL